MVSYVSILVYNPTTKTFPLVKKQKGPGRVIGKWTMPGGKIETGESIKDAAKRELREETGIILETVGRFKTLKGEDFALHVLYGATDMEAQQIEDEEIREWTVEEILESDEIFSENFLCMFPFLCSSLMSFGMLIKDDILEGTIKKLIAQGVDRANTLDFLEKKALCHKKEYIGDTR